MIACPHCGAFGRPFASCPSCGSAVGSIPRPAVALLLGLSVGCVGETKTEHTGESAHSAHSTTPEPDYGVALHSSTPEPEYGVAVHTGTGSGHTGSVQVDYGTSTTN